MNRSSSKERKGVKHSATELEQVMKLLAPDFRQIIEKGVNEYLAEASKVVLEALMQSEVWQICGAPYSRTPERQAVRWGSEEGLAIVDGAKISVGKPRVRQGKDGSGGEREIQLETYQAMNSRELVEKPLLARILAGVSTRRYASVIEPALRAKGISKSAVSRAAIAATKPTVDQFLQRTIAGLSLLVMLFDGIHLGGKQMIVCIGIDICRILRR